MVIKLEQFFPRATRRFTKECKLKQRMKQKWQQKDSFSCLSNNQLE